MSICPIQIRKCIFMNFKIQWSSPIHPDHLFYHAQRSRHVYDVLYENEPLFVGIAKCTCTCWMYLSISEDISVHIGPYKCSNIKQIWICINLEITNSSSFHFDTLTHNWMQMMKHWFWINNSLHKVVFGHWHFDT